MPTNLCEELRQAANAGYQRRSAAETNALIRQAQAGGEQGAAAERELLLSNINLILKAMSTYRNSANHLVSKEDLFQVASIGFVLAIRAFDPGRHICFSTFAYVSMRRHVARTLDNQARSIRISVHQEERRRRVAAATNALLAATGRRPSKEEIAREAKLTLKQVEHLSSLPTAEFSLDEMEDVHADGIFFAVTHGQKTHRDFDDRIQRDLLRTALRRLLTPREYRVLALRFGLYEQSPCELSVGEVATAAGVSSAKVWQTLKMSFDKLRTEGGPQLRALLH